MDPITPGIVSGLTVNIISAFTKKMTLHRRAREELDTHLQLALSGSSSKYRLSIAAELSSTPLPTVDEHRFLEFLKTPEATVFAHEVAVSVLLNEYADTSRSLIEQANALLIIVAGVSTQTTKGLGKRYCEILVASYEFCIDLLREEARRELRGLAREERKAGYLRNIAQRTATIRRQTPESIVEILQFVEIYMRMAHSGSSEVMPAHISDQQGIAIDQLYVEPNLLFDPTSRNLTVSLSNFSNEIYRDVILGDPGAGKSTLSLKMMYDLTQENRDTLATVPFLVTLRDFQQYKKMARSSVARYINSVMSEEYQLDPPQGAIEYLLATGKALVIFDGLDELLDTYKKREMKTAIEKFGELYATSRVLVTSRRVGYREAPLRTEVFRVSSLRPFDESQVIEYTVKWFKLDPTLTKNESRTLAESFINESSSIEDLRKNPLMLSLLCNLYRGARSIPRDRADLYERCAVMLFDRWDAQRGIIVPGPLRSDAREALQDIALWVFQTPGLINGVPHNRLIRQIKDYYYPDKYESPLRAQELAEELLALWRGRAWVLTDNGTTSSGETLYAFTHQTFLEYFAAIELARRNPDPESLWGVLAPRVSHAEWDIVAQVAIQSLNRSYRNGANLLLSMLAELAVNSLLESRLNLLNFASRYLDVFYPSPIVSRQVTRECVDLAIDAQSAYPRMPDFQTYMDGRSITTPSYQLQSDDLLAPLLQVMDIPNEIGEYAHDEFNRHLKLHMAGLNPTVQGKALLLALNYDKLPLSRHMPTFQGNAIDCRTVRRILKVAGKANFWIALEAARRGCIDAGQAAQISGVEILFCTVDSFEHAESASPPLSAIGFDLLEDLISVSRISDVRTATKKVLPGIASAFRTRLQSGSNTIDRFWLDSPDLHTGELFLQPLVVRPSLTPTSADWYRSALDDESLIHPLDAGMHINSRSSTKAPSPPSEIIGDDFFGAACLMATAIEIENWTDVYDHSDDRIADLRLGVLRSMAPIITARFLGESYPSSVLQEELFLSESDARVLERWTDHRLSFLHLFNAA